MDDASDLSLSVPSALLDTSPHGEIEMYNKKELCTKETHGIRLLTIYRVLGYLTVAKSVVYSSPVAMHKPQLFIRTTHC